MSSPFSRCSDRFACQDNLFSMLEWGLGLGVCAPIMAIATGIGEERVKSEK